MAQANILLPANNKETCDKTNNDIINQYDTQLDYTNISND